MVTIKQVQAFVACARAPSFAEAARELGVTAGAVTVLIRTLERESGGALFVRGSSPKEKTEMTPFAKELLPFAREILRGSKHYHDAASAYQVQTGKKR
jgi:DNA-binding transcriptional LysR family regulator